jgi:catechol 2,3-dioxygenase-like lactoylglutathione lyase family enzyme
MTNGMTAPQRPRLRAVPGGAEAPPSPADATRRDYWARVQARSASACAPADPPTLPVPAAVPRVGGRAYRRYMEMRLELVTLPVSDIDRAKEFYVDKVGFVADHDHTVSDDVRFVQLTPPGSACSIALGKGLTQLSPGSLDNLQIVVADADAARDELRGRGVDASDVDEQPWGRFVYFSDPDGNRWALQELPAWSTGAGGDGVNPSP